MIINEIKEKLINLGHEDLSHVLEHVLGRVSGLKFHDHEEIVSVNYTEFPI